MAVVREINKPDAREYLTVEEAATELKIKPTAIRNYLADGKLTTYKFKTLTLLSTEEIESWRRDRSRS